MRVADPTYPWRGGIQVKETAGGDAEVNNVEGALLVIFRQAHVEESGDLQEKKEEYSPDVPVSLNKTSLIIHIETSWLLFFSRELNML